MSVINSTNVFVTSTMGASITVQKISVSNFTGYTIQLVVAGGTAPTGTFKLQQSNDGVNWIDISGKTQAITDNGTWTFGDSNVYYNFVGLVYTRGSGSGNLVATFVGKG